MTTYTVRIPTTGWTTGLLPGATSLREQSAPRVVAYQSLNDDTQLAVSLVERSDGIQVEDAWIEVWDRNPDSEYGYWTQAEPVLLGDIELV
jgi:hypothetical protein